MISVTKPFLPPKQEYVEILSKVWESHWLTNEGPLVNQLEKNLKEALQLSNLLFVTSGTIALQMAIKALKLKGEIITTPFSFVATTSSIVWENCNPIFVDVEEESLNIDVSKIEEKITENTSAILATHVYGNPCDVIAIEKIAQKHQLKVIYDGAHAFGVQIYGKSIFEYGDISICSTHATKLFHSVEGGFIVTKENKLHRELFLMRNFGFKDKVSFANLGLNGKNSEFHAAMGLLNLKYIDAILNKRDMLTKQYDRCLENTCVRKPKWHDKANLNYAYYPIILKTEKILLQVIAALEENNIIARRYFYPSLAYSLPYVTTQKMEITDAISKRVLCLPLYFDLQIEDVQKITTIINRILNKESILNPS